MTNQQQAVKGTFTFQEREYRTYWNGKIYGNKRYVTTTPVSGGNDIQCTRIGEYYEANKAHSMDFAKAACASVGL